MAFGLGRLGWEPEEFWAATPREIAAALAAFRISAGAAPDRDRLAALMRAHPDISRGDDDGR